MNTFDRDALVLALDEMDAERIVRKARAQVLADAKRGASLVHDRVADDQDLQDRMWDFAAE